MPLYLRTSRRYINDTFCFTLLYTSYSSGIVESLKSLLCDDDLTVRHKSTECLYVIACVYLSMAIIVTTITLRHRPARYKIVILLLYPRHTEK